MPRAVNIEKIAEVLGEQPFDPIWESYVFGGSWGNHLTNTDEKECLAVGLYHRCLRIGL